MESNHLEYLGHKIQDIAFEKAGILRKNTPLIISHDYNSRSDTADLQSLKLDIDTRGFGNAQLIGKAEYQIGVKYYKDKDCCCKNFKIKSFL